MPCITCIALPSGPCVPEVYPYMGVVASKEIASQGFTSPASFGHATPRGKVRLKVYYPIKSHDPLLL